MFRECCKDNYNYCGYSKEINGRVNEQWFVECEICGMKQEPKHMHIHGKTDKEYTISMQNGKKKVQTN